MCVKYVYQVGVVMCEACTVICVRCVYVCEMCVPGMCGYVRRLQLCV